MCASFDRGCACGHHRVSEDSTAEERQALLQRETGHAVAEQAARELEQVCDNVLASLVFSRRFREMLIPCRTILAEQQHRKPPQAKEVEEGQEQSSVTELEPLMLDEQQMERTFRKQHAALRRERKARSAKIDRMEERLGTDAEWFHLFGQCLSTSAPDGQFR